MQSCFYRGILYSIKIKIYFLSTRLWKVYVLTTIKNEYALIDLRMGSLYIIEQIIARKDFVSCNNNAYRFYAYLDNVIDMQHQFYIFIEGRVNTEHRALINHAIGYTWNLTAYQTSNFVKYFTKNYQFTYLPNNEIYVDTEGKLQTKIVYFISSNGKPACVNSFDLLPKIEWIQDSMQKYGLLYSILDGNDQSVQAYDTLYYVDFESFIDPSHENDIGNAILKVFRDTYPGQSLEFYAQCKKKRCTL